MKNRSILLGVLFAAVIFTAACPKRVSIADIEANPGRYQDKDVRSPVALRTVTASHSGLPIAVGPTR